MQDRRQALWLIAAGLGGLALELIGLFAFFPVPPLAPYYCQAGIAIECVPSIEHMLFATGAAISGLIAIGLMFLAINDQMRT